MSLIFAYIHLPVSGVHVDLFEKLCFTDCNDALINYGQRIPILNQERIKCRVIHTEVHFSTFLAHNEFQGVPLWHDQIDDAFV